MLRKISAKDYMSANLVTLHPDTEVMDAVRRLLEGGVSGAPVADHLGNVVGILSEKDCIRVVLQASYYEERGGKVKEFMSTDVKKVDAESSLVEVAELFLKHPYRLFPVMDNNRLVGMIGRRDVLSALEEVW